MKRMMIWATLTAMLLGMLTGCGTNDPAPETNSTENLETEAMTQIYEAVPNQTTTRTFETPKASFSAGMQSRSSIERSRKELVTTISVSPLRVIFTSDDILF